jgi:putative DNA primase/helicase
MTTDPVAALVAKLEAAGCGPRSTGPDSWEARCPSHNGGRRNLSVRRGDDGRALLYCHHEPGCDPADIMAALGKTMADLFLPDHGCDRASENGRAKAKSKTEHRAHPTPEAAVAKLGEPSGGGSITQPMDR